MNYGSIKLADCANGPGMRTSLFVSGCLRHCPGCFNQETWDFEYGEEFTAETVAYILSTLDNPGIDGLSILGGEPLEPRNMSALVDLIDSAPRDKSIWVYTGYTWEEVMKAISYKKINRGTKLLAHIIRHIDVLVDGPYIEAEKDISLRFRGSRNQRIIDVQKSLRAGKVVLMEEYM